jgi:hypothetical protein
MIAMIEDESIDRVREHTDPEVLEQIDQKIEEMVRVYGNESKEMITHRIQQLEQEWDIERALETNGSILGLTGLFLGFTQSRKWFLLSAGVFGFCLQHAIQGWCPPLSVMRRLGFRTRREIEREKYALKVLRGDFEHVAVPSQNQDSIPEVLQAVVH